MGPRASAGEPGAFLSGASLAEACAFGGCTDGVSLSSNEGCRCPRATVAARAPPPRATRRCGIIGPVSRLAEPSQNVSTT